MSTPNSSAEEEPEDTAPLHDPYAALRITSYRRYLSGNLISLLGMQMQSTAVGWEIYQRTGDNLAVGNVGLIQVLPVLVLGLPAGAIADRFNRKRVIQLMMILLSLGSFGLCFISWNKLDIRLMYACLLINGISRAIVQPAKASMLPQLVPREYFASAITWNTSGFQTACIAGPALAGLLLAYFSPALIYLLEGLSTVVFILVLTFITVRPQIRSTDPINFKAFADGLRFVWETKIILGTLSLDLFAVLLGGAITLLPAYSKDVLFVDATGFGWLKTAPAVGALVTSFILANMPPMQKAGRTMLWSVAGFGVATIVFGLSRNYWLSLAMLALTGALDMISVVVRHTLVQLLTPDSMRGRVSAVNGMFIGASNELGGYESGVVAKLFERKDDPSFGPMVSVVTGGIGTLLVTAWIAMKWPQIRRYGPLDGKQTTDDET